MCDKNIDSQQVRQGSLTGGWPIGSVPGAEVAGGPNRLYSEDKHMYTQVEQQHLAQAERIINDSLDYIERQRKIIKAIKSGNLSDFLKESVGIY